MFTSLTDECFLGMGLTSKLTTTSYCLVRLARMFGAEPLEKQYLYRDPLTNPCKDDVLLKIESRAHAGTRA